MKVVVVGGTGLIGSKVVARLPKEGHTVVVAAPSTGVDIVTGEGLDQALSGASVVIDLTNPPSFEDHAIMNFYMTAGHNLLAAAAQARIKHHVVLSVVGTQRLASSPYFRGKIAQEEIVAKSKVPFTILHSTQFFEFLPSIIEGGIEDDDVVHLSAGLIQPIAAEDVALAVTRQALQPPANEIIEVAGPERASLVDFAQRYLLASGDSRKVVADQHATYYGARLLKDTLLPAPSAWRGSTCFNGWIGRHTTVRQTAIA
ncbi:Uncharacterized conserved protein YbjT, contains NAD(P)-binding and DUF2867 domains [Pseudoxanthomonas sp. GM95]|uniref:SDR family oxidoreductase n=1 Tax=Pseudoxanthomonas sp. GM95 TaxID=1881043 RepID=UPI0008C07B0E|nr:SDR family oxidoreductase [Pseudoxanthomonas sp. GM95]SEL11655.1 Uncharacterized conserved protein YbjT, contains NAD(P)-binding and DUF2867 domains [Pseudoxanthomonas sp. GM95]